ncbi:hypothetical protein PBI_GRAYSON_214 [Rhodococcus phage Grayson]|nr:hypothetical protein PBI_GRAYSON_214 [Rhodococcus phage Grayson]
MSNADARTQILKVLRHNLDGVIHNPLIDRESLYEYLTYNSDSDSARTIEAEIQLLVEEKVLVETTPNPRKVFVQRSHPIWELE